MPPFLRLIFVTMSDRIPRISFVKIGGIHFNVLFLAFKFNISSCLVQGHYALLIFELENEVRRAYLNMNKRILKW